jgi:hypothetical protein
MSEPSFQLIRTAVDESDEAVLPFGIEDLIKVLNPQEYQVLFDHFAHDGDYRALAEEMGMSKSQIARIIQRAITKAKTWVEQLKHGPTAKAVAYRTPLIKSAPWMNRRSWRPDRIQSEMLEHWWDGTDLQIVPFFTCGHDPRPGTYGGSSGMNQMQSGIVRWALCDACDQAYWRSLREMIETDLLEEHTARLEKMIIKLKDERGTEALGDLKARLPEGLLSCGGIRK